MRFKPGDCVGATYREEPPRFRHRGTVLAADDPRAWEGTVAFPECPVLAERVRAHVERCRKSCPGFDDKVPVAWDFGRVYWEPTRALFHAERCDDDAS